jgi:hypothetical protein
MSKKSRFESVTFLYGSISDLSPIFDSDEGFVVDLCYHNHTGSGELL